MKTITIAVFLSVALLGLNACRDENVTTFGATQIRVHNSSEYDYEALVVNDATFDELGSGENSQYQFFDTAYRYAYVRLLIDDAEFILQPIDYVGETPLGAGRFTYVIDVVDLAGHQLSISLITDN